MYEQLDIFSFPELQDKLIEQNFFWDSDINEIHNRLSKCFEVSYSNQEKRSFRMATRFAIRI